MSAYLNVVGPTCHELRKKQGLSQNQVAAKCTILGFRMSRAVYSKIEGQDRKVSDYELLFLAKIFKVSPLELLPLNIPNWTKHITTGHHKE